MAYCSVNKVRLVSGLESTQVTDGELRDLRDEVAIPELNQDVNQKVQDEKVNERISGEKENRIDGENTVFFLKAPHKSELQVGDRNNDGLVTVEDVNFYLVDGENNRVEDLSVELLDRETGKFDVRRSSGDPLSEGSLYVDYVVAPVDEHGYEDNDFSGEGPSRLVETACAQLTAAYAFTNIEASKLKDFSVGNVTINSQSEGARIMREEYRETRKRITQSQVVQSGPNKNSVKGSLLGVSNV